jgi:hypothetical protein
VRKQEIEGTLSFISRQLGQLGVLQSLPVGNVPPDNLLCRAVDVRSAAFLYIAIHVHEESKRARVFRTF